MTKQEAPLVDNAAADKAADADAALRELGEGLVSYGFLRASITVLDKDRAAPGGLLQRRFAVLTNRRPVVCFLLSCRVRLCFLHPSESEGLSGQVIRKSMPPSS